MAHSELTHFTNGKIFIQRATPKQKLNFVEISSQASGGEWLKMKQNCAVFHGQENVFARSACHPQIDVEKVFLQELFVMLRNFKLKATFQNLIKTGRLVSRTAMR